MKHKFFLTPMRAEYFRVRMEKDSTFKRCFTKDLTQAWEQEIRERSKSKIENHIVIIIYGQTGVGKTSCGFGIARMYDPAFTEKRVGFTTDEIEESIRDHVGPALYFRDETPKKYGTGSRREEERLATIAQTMRKAQLSLVLIRPEFFYFPGAHFYLEALQMGEGFENRLGVYDPNIHSYLGYIRVKVPKPTDPMWIAYQARKDEFLEKVKADDFQVLDAHKEAENLLVDPVISEYRGKDQLRIFVKQRLKNVTNAELMEVVTELHRLLKIKRSSEAAESE